MAEPVTSIDALQRSANMADDSWELGLMRAADAAGNRDGNISVAELDRYLAAPNDIRFVSASAVRQMRAELTAPQRVGLQTRPVHQFPQPWQRALAERADNRSNGDGLLAETELDEELFRGIDGEADRTRRVSDQGIAMLRSRIASTTHEPDLMRVTSAQGTAPRGIELLGRYARTVYGPEEGVPLVVSYVLAAADLREDLVERDGAFTTDERLPANLRISPGVYLRSGRDKGHMFPATDAATAEAMRETFELSNAAPQPPNLNRQVWRQLERAVREVVRATEGRAHIFTGTLFLNERGEPLAPSAMARLPRSNGRLGDPTHCFKAVLFELPNGHMTMVAFVVPNTNDVPTHLDDMQPLLQGARVAMHDLERMTGFDFFRDLPESIQRPMEASADACIALPPGTDLHAVSLLWPANCRPQSWTMPTGPGAAPPAAPPESPGVLARILGRLKLW